MANSMTQKIYESLKSDYNRTEDELKSVDKNLKKLTGTELFEKGSSRKIESRKTSRFDDKRPSSRRSPEMSRKRKLSNSSRIFSRLDRRLDDDRKRPSLQSTIVSTISSNNATKVKEENQIKEDKEPDKKSENRNRRMFGMIMGTLQKFQSEESQRKVITIKREQVEKKLDQADAEEREAVKQEKLSLIQTKKDKQTHLKYIETKMDRIEIHQQWEKSNQHLAGFIQTKTKPHIFYLPNKLLPETEKRLKETKDKYLIILAEKRAKIQKEIEDLNKKNEESKLKDEKLKNGDLSYNSYRHNDDLNRRSSRELKENRRSRDSSESIEVNDRYERKSRDNKKLKLSNREESSEDGECSTNEQSNEKKLNEDNSRKIEQNDNLINDLDNSNLDKLNNVDNQNSIEFNEQNLNNDNHKKSDNELDNDVDHQLDNQNMDNDLNINKNDEDTNQNENLDTIKIDVLSNILDLDNSQQRPNQQSNEFEPIYDE